MTIVLDANTSQTGSGTSLSWSHTVGTSKGMRALFVTFATRGGSLPGSITVTYGGIALTRATYHQDVTNTIYASIYYLVNPTTGSNTVSITWAGSATVCGGSGLSLYGVSQGSPILPASTTSEGPVTTNPSLTVTTANGGWAIDCLAQNGTTTMTIGAGQSSLINSSANSSHASYEALSSGSTVAMTWTKGTGGINHVGVGCSILPGAGRSNASVSPFLRF